jgi:hypothetical protein
MKNRSGYFIAAWLLSAVPQPSFPDLDSNQGALINSIDILKFPFFIQWVRSGIIERVLKRAIADT